MAWLLGARSSPAPDPNPFADGGASAAPAASSSSGAPLLPDTDMWKKATDAYHRTVCQAISTVTPRSWSGFLWDCAFPIIIGVFILIPVLMVLPKLDPSGRGFMTTPIGLALILIFYGAYNWWRGAPGKK